jgi:hypothetical protein
LLLFLQKKKTLAFLRSNNNRPCRRPADNRPGPHDDTRTWGVSVTAWNNGGRRPGGEAGRAADADLQVEC